MMKMKLRSTSFLRKMFFNIHLYLALVSSAVLFVVCLTGSIVAFEQELDRLFHPSLFYNAVPAAPEVGRIPLATLAERTVTGTKEKVVYFRVSDNARFTTGVTTDAHRQVFYNTFTGAVAGKRVGTTALEKIHQLHTNLLLGPPGKRIVGIATIILVLLALSGIYLWWPIRRVTIKWSASVRRIHFDIHNATGIIFGSFILILCISGLMINFDDTINPYLYRWTHSAPTSRKVQSKPRAGITLLPAERMIELAKAAIPGTALVNVQPPTDAKGAYRVSLHYPEDLTPGGRSWVNLDQYTGAILVTQDSRTPPKGTGIIITNRAIHTGDIFGIPSKVVASMSCVAVITEIITGIFLWWKKRTTRLRTVAS
ncbi:MAG: Propeptide, PepSY amd peptidase [Acidobacteriaceae bacterium]|nr:Propeptide, PepSY amd peptidase [Acidobacteriaceae bacterium]